MENNCKKIFLKCLIVTFFCCLILSINIVCLAEEVQENLLPISIETESGINYFNTLQEAIDSVDAITDEVIIKLQSNLEITSQINITGGKNITIDGGSVSVLLRGKDSAGAWYTGSIFSVDATSKLTLKNITFDGGNNWNLDLESYNDALGSYSKVTDNTKFISTAENAPIAKAWVIQNKGKVEILNSIIKNNFNLSSSGIISASSGTSTILKNTSILHCASNGSGGIISVTGANAVVNIEEGTVIDDNYVGGNGGILRIYTSSHVIMNGGEIKNTKGVNSNGSVAMMYGATFTLNGGIIKGNSSVYGSSNGRNAAIYVHSGGKFVMNGGTIEENNGNSTSGIDVAGYTNARIELNGGLIQSNVNNDIYIDRADVYIGADYDLVIGKDMTINGFVYVYGNVTNNGTVNGWISLNLEKNDDAIAYDGTGKVDGDVVIYHKPNVFPGVGENINVLGDVVYCDRTYQVILALVYNGGVNEKNRHYRIMAVDTSKVPTIQEPVREGYTFLKWYRDKELTVEYDNTPITESRIILYADWKPNIYTVTWDVDGKIMTIDLVYGDEIVTPEKPTKKGYTFKGWKNYEEGMTIPDNNVKFIAEWEINQYTVTFNSNGGSEVNSITQDYGTIVNKPVDPQIENGMEFQGWYTDEALTSAYDFNLPLEDSIVLYAKWAPKIENTVDNVSPSVDSNVGKNEDTNTTNITNATNATNNPNTGDNINTYIIMFIISSIVIVVNIIIVKKFDKKMFKSK